MLRLLPFAPVAPAFTMVCMDGRPIADAVAARLMLVDSHVLVRAGLRELIATLPLCDVVAEADSVDDALSAGARARPDIVLVDVELPGEHVPERVAELAAACGGARVIAVTARDEPLLVESMLEAGAAGYLLKHAPEAELERALRCVCAGELYVYPPLGAQLALAEGARRRAGLTTRERQVAQLLALGHTNQEVADQLYLSVRTAESHRAQVMGKLELGSRAELVRWALQTGVVGRWQQPA